MPIAAAYARVSSDDQNPMSIEDQLRRCQEIATTEGLTLDAPMLFSDYAITGKAKGTIKRVGYRRLLDCVEARECEVLIVDEICRLTRHMSESARLMDLVKEIGLRVISHDGIDTNTKGWETMWALKMIMAHAEVESTSERTKRGMIGRLINGFQIAPPPFGYRCVPRPPSQKGQSEGTLWSIHEEEAAVVRQMYEWRYAGLSIAKIAAKLQEQGVMPPGLGRCKSNPFWRAGSVYRVLTNTIYKGVFIWNGSNHTKSKARRQRKAIETQEFERPQLRLVSDELWTGATAAVETPWNGPRRSVRGGGRHLFSGLTHCGDCKALLCVGGNKKSQSLYCPQCESTKRVGGSTEWIGYSSVTAARQALEWVLREMFTGDVLAEFHQLLRQRMTQGPALEEQLVRKQLSAMEPKMVRLKVLLMDSDVGDEVFRPELTKLVHEQKVLRKRLEVLKEQTDRMTPDVLECQLAVDPLQLLHDLLRGDCQVYKVKATLKRLIPGFELVARPRSGCSIFRFTLAPGVCVAELTDTAVMDSSSVSFEVEVSTTKRRPVVWTVSGRRIRHTD